MTTVTLITRADVHVADHPPEMRSDDWRTTIMGKLRQINGLAKKHGADAIIDAGDLFYIKRPMLNSHSLVRELVELHLEASCPTFGIAGNHDIKHDNLTTLSGQPLSVLYQSGAIHPMEGGTWLDEGKKVWLVGIPYQKNLSAMDLDIVIPDDPKPLAVVAVVHFFAQPGGGDFFGTQTLSYEDLAEMYPEVDAWVFGHWHQDQGVYLIDRSDGRTEIGRGPIPFVNVGAVSRGALRGENITRNPKVGRIIFTFHSHDWDEEEGLVRDKVSAVSVTAEEIELEVEPPEKVFRMEDKQRIEKRMDLISEFAGRLKKKTETVREEGLGVEAAATELLMVTSDEVREVAEGYLREAGVSLRGI